MSAIDQAIKCIVKLSREQAPDDLKNTLIRGIMELTHDERKELLAMWKGRKST